ncbi:peptide chain release factor N(5)-glutamine methyltransferase [Arcanobacterium pinnipediorum]|uniref:peptide chain release factor N(5)-glutamine methyltransferase n=1 Tax=Arcanobacterium pinnipediorum TaxID=1503041 RepID=A0ABY5AHN1_9ACTO|nr:peptide chain release factor N(5)-glutamine methyltransferase [Arcanobacterium pinnipediorum]USR79712.1 peptide chain release factor N(5)-glutamine methyltransferase [Arcanobacterium pinnipediorum]
MATWGQAIACATQRFSDAGLASPEVDARLLAQWIHGSNPELSAQMTPGAQTKFDDATSRRAQFEPLQHIIGLMWFRYLELRSKPGVFIVRPETEMVAQAGIDVLEGLKVAEPVVVDLCTGSGAIAIAIATEVPRAHVWAVELDPTAYQLARLNNENYGSRVHMVQADAATALPQLRAAVDVVITNPPYVPQSLALPPEVLRDPPAALFGGGDDGLEIPRILVKRAYELLKPGGVLIMEHGDDQGKALVDFAQDNGFIHGSTGRDLTGRDRWLYAEKEGL